MYILLIHLYILLYFFVCVMRTFKIYSLCNFQIHRTVDISLYVLHDMAKAYSSYNWKFIPLSTFTHFTHS